MFRSFTPADWYWIVGGAGPHLPDERDAAGQLTAVFPPHDTVFSGKANAYVPVDDPEYQAWRVRLGQLMAVEEPATRIDSEKNLRDVLAVYGIEPKFGPKD